MKLPKERCINTSRHSPFTIRRNLLRIPNPIFIFKTKESSLETAPAGGAVACKQDNQRAPPTGRSKCPQRCIGEIGLLQGTAIVPNSGLHWTWAVKGDREHLLMQYRANLDGFLVYRPGPAGRHCRAAARLGGTPNAMCPHYRAGVMNIDARSAGPP